MLEAGHILEGKYRLQSQLSLNPVRQVWLAEDITLQETQPVIVKLLTSMGQLQWGNLRLFEREAKILQQLDHPRIPKYRDFFHLDQKELWFGLVEDYIPGISLKTLLDQNQYFSESEVYDIATQILEILQYLHNLNPPVLHRDLKPSNLILNSAQQVYLIDFGTVQAQTPKDQTFTVVGTYGYTPIEQFGGQAVEASDLYALGVKLIHLLTGTSPSELLQEDGRLQFQTASAQLDQWLEKMTAPYVSERLQDAETALQALPKYKERFQLKRPKQARCKVQRTEHQVQIRAIPVKLESSYSFLNILHHFSMMMLPITGTVVLASLFGETTAAPGIIALCLTALSLRSWFFCIRQFIRRIAATRSTWITLTSNLLQVQYKLFGFTYQQIQIPARELISVNETTRGRERGTVVTCVYLSSSRGKFIIARNLATEDSAWVMQEVKNWAKIS